VQPRLAGDLAGRPGQRDRQLRAGFTTPDQREGMDAFFEKRPADFS